MPLLFPRQAGKGLPGGPGTDGPVGPPGVEGTGDPRVACVVTGGPTITQGTWQRVNFESVLVDDAGLADLTTRPDELKVAVAGAWFVSANIRWPVGLTKIEARIVAPDDTGNPVVIDTDTRKGAERTCSLVQLLNMFQNRSVYLEVRYTGGPSSVTLEAARLGMTGGRGVRLYHDLGTMIDVTAAWALSGAYDILSETDPLTPIPAPSPDASSDNPGDVQPGPSGGCGPLVPRPPWPFTGGDSGGGTGGGGTPPPAGGGSIGGGGIVRRAIRLLAASGDGYTWPNHSTDGCAYAIDHGAFAATARGIAICDPGTKFGFAAERADGSKLKLGWMDGTASLSYVVGGVETELESWALAGDSAVGVPYELTFDCFTGYYRVSINREVRAGYYQGDARRLFPSNSLIRGGLFTETGNTILVPGPRITSGPIITHLIPGEAHLEHVTSGVNRALQQAWPRLTVDKAGGTTVHIKGECAAASVGRTLKVTISAYDAATDALLTQATTNFTIPASPFSLALPFVASLPKGARVSVRLDDAVLHGKCDTIDLNRLSYWL